jgi:very-short-patch-repair endonuclease
MEPGSKLFDRKYSLYHLAKANLGSPIRLREHFRCAPEIIQFSNALSYDFEIQALRDISRCSIRPHVVPYKVEGVRGDGKINVAEAEAIASLVSAMCEMPEYATASIGVVSLLGDEQARYIDTILGRRIPAEEYDRRRIVCGNAYQFQGDQRNVMLLSMVESPGVGPARLLSSGSNDMYKKRFNVAASRAEDQMWVVYSLSPETDLKSGDLRKRLIDHALNPAVLLDRIEGQSKRVESEFERQVLARLVAAGFQVTSQWAVGSYRIDLVVEGAGKRLAVECDGDRYHGAEQLDNDMRRQQLLERLGWTFVRIRGTEYFRSPEGGLRPVLAKLAELGIAPKFDGNSHQSQSEPILERVIRRAAEIRRQWGGLENEPGEDNAEAKRKNGFHCEVCIQNINAGVCLN